MFPGKIKQGQRKTKKKQQKIELLLDVPGSSFSVGIAPLTRVRWRGWEKKNRVERIFIAHAKYYLKHAYIHIHTHSHTHTNTQEKSLCSNSRR